MPEIWNKVEELLFMHFMKSSTDYSIYIISALLTVSLLRYTETILILNLTTLKFLTLDTYVYQF